MCKFVWIVLIVGVCADPKKYKTEEGGFNPTGRYYESDLPYQGKQYKNGTVYVPHNPIGAEKKESRFGAITYNPSGNGYGGGNGMAYGTAKLDLNGVVLGALIGLGAILIVPKLAQIFAGGHEGYARNLDEEMYTLTNVLSKIDTSLAANSIDSTQCTQRIVCGVVADATKNAKQGEATNVDDFVLSITRNPLFAYATGNTAIKEAVEIGRAQDADKCQSTFPKCPLNRDNIVKVVSGLLPF